MNDGVSANILTIKNKPLRHVDNRTDQEITSSLLNPSPVTTEKNVWAFWDGGFTSMPPWCQRNALGWVRLLGPSWTVRVLDLVPGSPANILGFLDAENLPDHVGKVKTGGAKAGPNLSDTLRLPCIYQHGGVWLDLGITLFMDLDDVCWKAISSPASRYEVAVASGDPSLESGVAENFFVAARKGNGLVYRWMIILREAWKGKTSNKGIHAHPLFTHLIEGGNITSVFAGASGDRLDYFQAYLAWERLRLLEDPNDGFSGPKYCKNRVLLLEYQEFASAAMLTDNHGPTQFDYFVTSTKPPPASDEAAMKKYQEAKEFCEHLLGKCAMMKLYRWRDGGEPTLAELWDDKDKRNGSDADNRPGTFGEQMRYISSHYTQDRRIVPLKFPAIKEKVLVAGVLEY